MKSILIAAAMAVSAIAMPAFAGDHGSHPPMGPPLSDICAAKPAGQQFACLHPSYVAMLAGRGLSITFSSPDGCAPKHSGGVIVVDPGTGKDTCGNQRVPPI